MWRAVCAIAFIIQLVAQGLLLFLLEPGHDISEGAYQALKVITLVYAGASIVGGLVLSGWITIGMALVACALTILITLALWREETPVRAAIERVTGKTG